MNELVIGDAATGKTYVNVAYAVRNYQGRIILLESSDVREYLKLPDGYMESCTVKELEEIAKEDSFTRLQVIVDGDFRNGIAEYDVSLLRTFIEKYKNCDDLLLIVDDAQMVCPFVQELVVKEFSGKADKMVVLQNLDCIARNYDRSYSTFVLTFKELLRHWNVVYRQGTIHIY